MQQNPNEENRHPRHHAVFCYHCSRVMEQEQIELLIAGDEEGLEALPPSGAGACDLCGRPDIDLMDQEAAREEHERAQAVWRLTYEALNDGLDISSVTPALRPDVERAVDALRRLQ